MNDSDVITVFLADDNLIARKGVGALLEGYSDVQVVGVAEDRDGLIEGVAETAPQVVVTDIRMPPHHDREGIDAAEEIRRRDPTIGIVILSQFQEPALAVALMQQGSRGYAYLMKERVAEEDQLARAVREVAVGGTMIDSRIVNAILDPVRQEDGLTSSELRILEQIASGRSIKAIATRENATSEDMAASIDSLFTKLGEQAGRGHGGALRHLKALHKAIVEREEFGTALSKHLPGGVAQKIQLEGTRLGESEHLEVTVVMSDVRDFCGIAERTDAGLLARQLNEHYSSMNEAVLTHGGTIMQFVGDSVYAVFGAPEEQEDHADRAALAALEMSASQTVLNKQWLMRGLPAFHLGIGVSTGRVAAALVGSQDRFEYTLVGDAVNLAQRLQGLAKGGEIVLSDATKGALTTSSLSTVALQPVRVKGREGIVAAHRLLASDIGGSPDASASVPAKGSAT